MIAQEDLVANILTKTVLSLTQWSTTSKLEHRIARLSVFLNIRSSSTFCWLIKSKHNKISKHIKLPPAGTRWEEGLFWLDTRALYFDRATNHWEPIPENEGREYFHRENPDWERIYEEFARVLPDRIVKANKAEKRPRSNSNQVETPEPKRTNQGNSMSGNPGSTAPPVPPQGPPPGLPPVPPPGLQQNPLVCYDIKSYTLFCLLNLLT